MYFGFSFRDFRKYKLFVFTHKCKMNKKMFNVVISIASYFVFEDKRNDTCIYLLRYQKAFK